MLFTVALFVWDDTIDTNEHMLASDFERAELWREQSLAYFKYHLQLSSQHVEPACPDDICLLFREFAERFCGNFGEGQSAFFHSSDPLRRPFGKNRPLANHKTNKSNATGCTPR